jgi:tetratricopeptide (TPR) repeat protein
MKTQVTLLNLLLLGISGCATTKSLLAVNTNAPRSAPIQNPFMEDYSSSQEKGNIILRTKKGDRAIEIELPGHTADMTEFVVPIAPAFKEDGRSPASSDGTNDSTVDERYKERASGITDREITGGFSKNIPQNTAERQEIESGLGVVPAEDPSPPRDRSYLASIDQIKQLYKRARYEAALLELDELVRLYPTDPKLYEMRGTLLDRIGRTDLAIKSWNQALRFDPGNDSLRRFIEHKSKNRRVASPPNI